jgi:uncharacterized protein
MPEQTFFCIRPYIFEKRNAIKKMMIDEELEIKATKIVWLNPTDIQNIYGHESPSSYYNACLHFMRNGFVEVGIIEGQNAIESLVELCGKEYISTSCTIDTIRNKFGLAKPVRFNGADYYFNPIHRSSNTKEAKRETDYFWKHIHRRTVSKIVSDMVKRLYTLRKLRYIYQYHIKPAVKIGKELSKEYGADKMIVELALWLHDLERFQEDKKDEHHLLSANYAKKVLELLGCKRDIIEAVKYCILTHRGSINLTRNNIEAEIVASADGIVNIKYVALLYHFAFKKKNLEFNQGLRKIKLKIDQSYEKIFESAKQKIEKEYSHWQEVFELFHLSKK